MSQEPLSIMTGPLDVYIAPVGESMPGVSTSPPGGNWTLLGTNGDDSYSEDGVTISPEQSFEEFRTLGSTSPIKVKRTEEGLAIRVPLVDVTPAEFAKAMNFNTVTDNTTDEEFDLYRGPDVATRALLVRGKSPLLDGGIAQFEVPRCYPGGEPELSYTKGGMVTIEVEFRALNDLNAASDAKRLGVYRVQK